MNDDNVRFTVQMPERLREDAKRNSERGELSEQIRDLFRRQAYGAQAGTQPTEVERKKQELEEVRQHIDDLRHKRSKIETEIESQETRATRLEEQISKLEKEQDKLAQTIETVENMLHTGNRMWPTRLKNAADVDRATAEELYERLRERNPDVPDVAFEEPSVHGENDWREVEDGK